MLLSGCVTHVRVRNAFPLSLLLPDHEALIAIRFTTGEDDEFEPSREHCKRVEYSVGNPVSPRAEEI